MRGPPELSRRASAAFSPPFPPVFFPPTHPMSSSPARSPEYEFEWAPSTAASATMSTDQPPPKIIDDLSPPLIAMLAVAGAALLIVLYARLLSRHLRRLRHRWSRWRRCRRLLRSSHSDFGSGSESVTHFSPPPPPPFPFSSESDNLLSPYGLDDSAIKTLPLSLFSRSKAKQPISADRDCAVCLFEFDDGEWLRTLPICGHAFHIECIDVWLRSRPTCPLCRSAITFRSDSPFVPMRAGRIRPSFDDIALERPAARDPFMLKRSYSFGFERSAGADRMSMSGSPSWRVRMQGQSHQQRGFWSKRWASPFGGGRACYQRGGVLKSPFGRRWGFVMFNGGVGSSAMGRGRGGLGFSSSRMRCGDPEALISPERFNRR